MADANPSGSLPQTVADRVGNGTTEAFELLGDWAYVGTALTLQTALGYSLRWSPSG